MARQTAVWVEDKKATPVFLFPTDVALLYAACYWQTAVCGGLFHYNLLVVDDVGTVRQVLQRLHTPAYESAVDGEHVV